MSANPYHLRDTRREMGPPLKIEMQTAVRLARVCRSTKCCRHCKLSVLSDYTFDRSVQFRTTDHPFLRERYETGYDEKLKVLFGKEHPQPNKDEIKFSDFKSLRPSLQAQLGVLGFDKPMPVQHETLKATLQGRDAVIKSVTGSGKTLAFVLPLLNKIGAQRKGIGGQRPQAIITAPTRQLCRQISNVVESFIGEERLIRMWAGMGERVRGQAKHARAEGRDIVIATPGRTMQLVSMNIIRWVPDYNIHPDLPGCSGEKGFARKMRRADTWSGVRTVFSQNKPVILPEKALLALKPPPPTEPSKEPIRTRYLGHGTGYQPIRDQYFLIWSQADVPASVKHKAVLVDGKLGFMAMKWILKMDHRGCTMVFVRRIKQVNNQSGHQFRSRDW
eukprot:sb/3465545/